MGVSDPTLCIKLSLLFFQLQYVPLMKSIIVLLCGADLPTQGRIQDFHLGGRKRLCAHTNITSVGPNSLSAGVQGLLKGPGSSRVVLMLSRAIWALLFKHSDFQKW